MPKRTIIEVARRGPRGQPGTMTPAEWQDWQDQLTALESRITSLEAALAGGAAGDALVKADETDHAFMWGLAPAHYSEDEP